MLFEFFKRMKQSKEWMKDMREGKINRTPYYIIHGVLAEVLSKENSKVNMANTLEYFKKHKNDVIDVKECKTIFGESYNPRKFEWAADKEAPPEFILMINTALDQSESFPECESPIAIFQLIKHVYIHTLLDIRTILSYEKEFGRSPRTEKLLFQYPWEW